MSTIAGYRDWTIAIEASAARAERDSERDELRALCAGIAGPNTGWEGVAVAAGKAAGGVALAIAEMREGFLFKQHDHFILDENGEPIETDLMTWATWLEADPIGRRRLKWERVWGAKVSTVFLGLNHNFMGEGPPVLWETLVFGGPLDGEMERYCSREDALRGHAEMCTWVRRVQLDPRQWPAHLWRAWQLRRSLRRATAKWKPSA